MLLPLHDAVPLALAALLIEAAFGFPDRLFRAVGHPVTWMGALLSALERRLNRPERSFWMRRAAGALAWAALMAVTAAVTLALQASLGSSLLGSAVLAIMASSLPAQRSLHSHVRAVAEALDREGLEAGRRAVSMIVGRNTAALDAHGVARAAIESLAENFADGVVAPAFWTAIGGLAGGALYKAANTADSMVGHRNPRYAAFGWASARFDDLVNLPASRLAALLIVVAAPLCGGSAGGACRAVWRDAGRHRSPNAGWPEAATAGALGLQLNGPKVYGGVPTEDAFMGDGRRDATPADIRAALKLYRAACRLQVAALAALAAVLWA